MKKDMKKEKKPFILKRFAPYMGEKKLLLPVAMSLSALSAVLNAAPLVLIWYMVRIIVASPGGVSLSKAGFYARLGFITAVAALILYFLALTSSHLAAFRVETGMQKVGMKKIMGKPLGFFDQYPTGKIRKIVNDGASTTHTFLAHQLPDLAGSIISPVILLVLLFVFEWRMGLAALIPIILGFVTMQFMMNTQGKEFQKNYFDSLEEMSAESVEYVRGIPVVKTFGQSIFAFRRFYDSIIRYRDMVYAYTCLWRVPMTFYTAIMQSAAFFLIPAAILIMGRGAEPAAVLTDFFFYILISPMFTMLLMRSMYFRQNIMVAEQALDRLDALLAYEDLSAPCRGQIPEEFSLEFKDVVFSYEADREPAVNGVSFRLNPGETGALVGASGGGKTTIARLAARFWDPAEGEVLIGGVNIKKIPKKELMEKISFVFQNTRLMKGTLRENIVFGMDPVTEEAVRAAVEGSRSSEIVEKLPAGLDTVIGSGGIYLSGGEQQRIALARALLKDAPIVLLDEATAFADPENEHLIQKALQEVGRGKTTLMIAHRLTSVQNADKIFVIDRGKVAETGTHAELMEKGGLYRSMWDEYQKSAGWKVSSEKKNA